MIMKAYSIRDQKGEVFNLPFFKITHGQAERDFESLVNDGKSTLNAYPEDFDLYHIGEYDDQKGTFIPMETPTHLIKAVQLYKKPTSN